MIPTTARILASDADCGGCNTGQCVEPAISNLSNYDPSTTLGTRPSCNCKDTGFIGEHCDVPCSLQCRNGGKCQPASNEDEQGNGDSGGNGRGESCSCSKAVVDGNPFAGLTCEYGATKSCMMLESASKHSFCTNGGECQDIVGDNEQHKDCICEGGFEGPHCEYIVGTAPSKQLVAGASGAENGAYHPQANSTSNVVVYAMILVIVVLIGVLLLAFGARARKRRADAKQREKQVREATEDLSMIPTHNQPENEII
mmetsp:Transcript_1503/g.2266  ORF Transcript_1503/g.2266 Transcript_1503/m.2266 type:complete len:256 (-) Transcript_1503:212-979(-)